MRRDFIQDRLENSGLNAGFYVQGELVHAPPNVKDLRTKLAEQLITTKLADGLRLIQTEEKL